MKSRPAILPEYHKGARVEGGGTVTAINRGADWIELQWDNTERPMRQDDAAFWIGSGRLQLEADR